tara:strand:+ start:66 stop:2513 length:2448 start_codon:yes stop_codon:yes gene_type:complete
MKKLYILLSFLTITSFSFGQTAVTQSDFTNAGGDKLWSNAANWSNGIPNTSSAKVTLKSSMILDENVTIGQIILAEGFGDVSVTSSSVCPNCNRILTLTGEGVSQPILNNGGNVDLKLDLKVVINSSDAVETFQANAVGTCSITFGSNSDLTLNVPTKFVAQNIKKININGLLRNTGTGQLQVGEESEVVFGGDSDNSNYTAGFKMLGKNGLLISNMQSGTFLSANSTIEPDATIHPEPAEEGHKIYINGPNTFKGNIKTLDDAVTLYINANQSGAGLINIGSGNLNLNLDAAVTQLAFADNSSSAWGSGKVIITGFKDNVISFGTNASGLTTAQLAKIDIGGSSQVDINSSGQIATKIISQSTFDNAGGDKLWSNVANWSNGLPNVTYAQITVTDSLILDQDVTIGQIKLGAGAPGPGSIGPVTISVSSINDKTLTLTGEGVKQPIQNNRENAEFYLDLKVILNSSDDEETFEASASGTCSISFGSNSDLTINVPTKFMAQNNRSINLYGILRGTGLFQVGAASKVNFKMFNNVIGSDNSAFTGGFKMLGNDSELTANTLDDGIFLPSGVTIESETNSTGHNININGENIYKGDIKTNDNALYLNINKNQSTAGLITLGNGNLNLTLDATVTQLAFADNSISDWGISSKVVITGFKNNVISFGTDASGLTMTQLTKIDIGGDTVLVINEYGQIVKDTDGDGVADDKDTCPNTPTGESVDVNGCPIPLFIESVTFIENIYPNPAKDYLKVILKDNSKVKDIFFVDLSGKILQPINVYQLNSRELDVYVSNLDNGIYLLNINTNKEFNKVKVIIDR